MPAKKKEDVGDSKFDFPDGSRYVGRYVLKTNQDGKRSQAPAAAGTTGSGAEVIPYIQHENGTYFDCSGATYGGQWKEGNATGRGTLNLPNGTLYEGGFLDNRYSGTGQYTWPDGSHYVGEWENGRMHGEGSYTDSTGRRWRGKFIHGIGENLTPELYF